MEWTVLRSTERPHLRAWQFNLAEQLHRRFDHATSPSWWPIKAMLPLRYGNLTWLKEREKERVSILWFSPSVTRPHRHSSLLWQTPCHSIIFAVPRWQSGSLWTPLQRNGRRVSYGSPFYGTAIGSETVQDSCKVHGRLQNPDHKLGENH